jgi:hypothetical protein
VEKLKGGLVELQNMKELRRFDFISITKLTNILRVMAKLEEENRRLREISFLHPERTGKRKRADNDGRS